VTYHADRVTRVGVNVAAMVLDVVEGKDPTTGAVVREPVRLLSVDGLDSRDETYRMRLVFAAEMARSERERIKDRNLATQARLRKAGRFQGGG
jgi:site-specific DNA recombinase